MPLAAATKESSPSAAIPANAQQAKSGPGIVPKMICGIGVTFALAVVAAAVMSNPPEPSPGPVAPVMPVHVTEKAVPSPSNRAVSTTPAGAVPAPLVADPIRPVPPVAAVAPAPPPKQCDQPQRKFYVSGNGTIRIHDGTDVSAPVVLDVYPREVIFPLARPAAGASEETITVEGNASAVVMTTDLPSFRRTFYHLKGATSFIAHWVSLRN
ncbi:MAG TPA: hypothetical protein VJ226_03935, partial [Bradyrhizobium sp.]|nr:hypothetical protein [Bradyrhizobium sp.]